ncbi:RcpC/CpaB family pilus assembly protein [Arthrobacter crystallopoietes]|uniref:Flp pilus assembly protein CpaB n=1 Tax=Crystallibacter crystallopoietes TaxID=37928 RepID=UPI003D1A10DE
MKSRKIAGFSAIAIALLGIILIFSYTRGAEARAMADLEPTQVLVVQKTAPAGTRAEELAEFVAVEERPASSVPPSALRDLKDGSGKVTAVELIAGEQLLAERLVAPEDFETSGSVEVPKGLQEVSFQLEPQRVVGGRIAPGDNVGVFISMTGGGLARALDKETTQLVLHKTLVTAVQRAPQPVTEEGETDAQALPEGSMLVTVAVDDKAAQKIVFAAEFAKIWLSKEPLEAKESKPTVVQRSEVYR